ncbi:unnamed protein product [Porites evermanni]|uniref:Uncharacterized protein n=1 Tax=Porites evermanni TaxID=104178 RepID=A0ABN8SYY3_9CNID|nr:unnamed protein product [Porites evermanni]
MPVVRNQTFVHIMDWIKLASSDNGVSSEVFPLVKDNLISVVWECLRNNNCWTTEYRLIECTLLKEISEKYSTYHMCLERETSWQAKEGAVMGMTAIVCQFLWSGITSDEDKNKTEGRQYLLKFGFTALSALPDFIMSSVHSVIFSLLVHPQLSIREHATKALSAILSRCEFEVALFSFQEVINRLCRGTQGDGHSQEVTEGIVELPHHAVLRQNFKFLKAHEAEGLLAICIFLIKHIPPGYLLPKWPLYFSTFNLYLMHPASTVRQVTSVAFKYLVAKDSNNPVFLKLVLHGLAADWKVDKGLLVANLVSSPEITNHLGPSTPNTPQNSEEDAISHVHEREIPFQRTPSPKPSLDLCYVSADSISTCRTEPHNAFSVGHSTSWTSQTQSHKSTRTSIRQVAKLLAEDISTSADHLMSKSWEWREGRLLAYELILKFLITNHIHYVFPAFVLPVSKNKASSASVDESLISSLSSKIVGNETTGKVFCRDRSNSDFTAESAHKLCLKSNSVGVINSSSGTLYTTTTIKEGETGVMERRHAAEGTLKHSSESRITSKKKPMRAASCAGVDVDTQTRQLIRQYSVTTPQISPKRPFRLPRTSTFVLGNSLLNQTKALDSEQSSSEV